MQVLFEIIVQIQQKRGIGVETPSPRSFSGGYGTQLSYSTKRGALSHCNYLYVYTYIRIHILCVYLYMFMKWSVIVLQMTWRCGPDAYVQIHLHVNVDLGLFAYTRVYIYMYVNYACIYMHSNSWQHL